MLSELRIENVAVIEKATVSFRDGFNVLTGETGAGKSILIDSITAVLGGRSSKELVRSGADKACIWALFTGVDAHTEQALQKNGYTAENGDLLLYREIGKDGRNVFRINGLPATAGVLREVSADLLHIQGQHDSQGLLNPARHIGILDAFADNKALHSQYYAVYKALCSIKKQVDTLSLNEEEKQKRIDLLTFQINELNSAAVEQGEEERLLAQRNRLRNAELIRQQLALAAAQLGGTEDEPAAVAACGAAADALERIAPLTEQYAAVNEKAHEAYYALQELLSELNGCLDNAEMDPQLLEDTEIRLNEIYQLKQKYRVDADALSNLAQQLQTELEQIELSEQKLDELYEKQDELYTQAKQLAAQLTETRLQAFAVFNGKIAEELQFLNMPGIAFTLQHSTGPLTGSGQDGVEFYITTNPGEAPKPMAKIASGGELSRILLAVKSTLAEKDAIPTVIYDEIDAGVSGLAASRVGQKLKQTAGSGRQVICITHTAQIASMAATHLLIQKTVQQGRAYTQIRALTQEERVQELAKLIAGDRVTEAALQNARELLQNA